MIGSHRKKFIFFHLYKVAGTSLRNVLSPYQDFRMNKHDKPNMFLNKFGRDLYDKYYTFAFVRNPWDWQVSLYFYMLRDYTHHQHNLMKSFNGDYTKYVEWRVNEDCKPQYMFLSENADLESPITLDFIGRYENLNQDFEYVKNHLALQGNLPHLNKTDHKKYKEYYNKDTWRMIQEAYKIDIDYFGYDEKYED